MRRTGKRGRLLGTLSLLLSLWGASLPGIALAGPGVWTSGGPFGGSVYALAMNPSDPTILYAGTGGSGVFRSTDAGGTWAAASAGLTNLMVHALAVSPSTPTTIFAGTGSGIFKSTDSGATWTAASPGLAHSTVNALAIDPATPSTLYAGSYGGVVSKSTDSGGTWAASSTGLTEIEVRSLAIDPTFPARLYAGTGAGGVYRSTDSGASWAEANAGLTTPDVTALAADPRTPGTLYAGTMGNFGGLFKSTDAGNTWKAASVGLTEPHVRALAINPSTPSTLYAGTNGGGVFKSVDSGGTWVATGLTYLYVYALAIDSASPSTLYAGAIGAGAFKSTDSGGAWTAASTGLEFLFVRALAVDPSVPSTLYAGTAGFGGVGVLRSTDAGGSWSGPSAGSPLADVYSLAVDPAPPHAVYAGTYYTGVFRSDDSGVRWAPVGTGLPSEYVRALALDPAPPVTLYAGLGGGGILKSTGPGGAWTETNTGLASHGINALAISRGAPATLYAGTGGGVFRSADSGGTWSSASAGLTSPGVLALAISPSLPSTLYAGTGLEGVFRSTDSAGHWIAAGKGLPAPPWVNALAVDPVAPATLYAGTAFGGIYRSTDSGESWTAQNEGLPGPPYRTVTSLALDPAGATTLFAGFEGGGVWQFTPSPAAASETRLLPSSARAAGAGGAFYTTDLSVANGGSGRVTVVLKFLGNNVDGRSGPEKSFPISAGESKSFPDVLGTVFGRTADFGAIRVTSPSGSVHVLAQTSTPGFGGTFGQSVPAARPEDLIAAGAPRSILAVREDASFRTNLILANAGEAGLEVDVQLVSAEGPLMASKRYPLPPLGMMQVTRVVRDLGVAFDLVGARLVLSTPTTGGAFAAYASVIDNVTNDPRTLLPVGPSASAGPAVDAWLLPSSARAGGAGGAFYTTDLTVAYAGGLAARFTLKFLGNNGDGRAGPETTFDLGSRKSVTYTDVLGSVFQRTADFGAIRVSSQDPGSDSANLAVLAQTSTPGFGGTFGQSVPAASAADLIRPGSERSILAVREDVAFRTNLILANATEAPLDVDVRLISAEGTQLAAKRYPLPPLGMTQVTKVVRDLGLTTDLAGARLVLTTATVNGAFAAYASVIDNVTNDPRTLLPR